MTPGSELLQRYFLMIMAVGSVAVVVVALYGMFLLDWSPLITSGPK